MPPNTNHFPSMPNFDPTQALPKPKRSFGMLIALIVTVLLLLGAAGFGFWAYSERQDYKDNSDAKSAEAVVAAEEVKTAELEADFAEREKNPYKEYKGPATFGSVSVTYPRTWSAFVTESDRSSIPLDGYFHPDVVPGLQSGTAFALHIQVTGTTYDQELKKFDAATRNGEVKATPISAPKVPGVAGVRLDGEIEDGKQGSLVLFPMRDKTLKLSTESNTFASDFNDIILANLTFSP